MDMGRYVHFLQQLSTPFVFLHVLIIYPKSNISNFDHHFEKNLCSFITCELYIMKVSLREKRFVATG